MKGIITRIHSQRSTRVQSQNKTAGCTTQAFAKVYASVLLSIVSTNTNVSFDNSKAASSVGVLCIPLEERIGGMGGST